jgi:predicted nucleic acid-binding protein
VAFNSLERTRDLMNNAIRDCLVTGYESIISGLKLPDANDRHVLAAAIRSNADTILTYNLKDFGESLSSGLKILSYGL